MKKFICCIFIIFSLTAISAFADQDVLKIMYKGGPILIVAPVAQIDLEIPSDSPVNALIKDVTGKRLGFDPITGNYINEIPDAAFDTLGTYDIEAEPGEPTNDTQVYYIKNPSSSYTIILTGTGNGSYSIWIKAEVLDNDKDDDAQGGSLEGNITLGQQIEYSLLFDKTSEQLIKVAKVGMADSEPPESFVGINSYSCVGSAMWFNHDAAVTITATDLGSWVKEIHYQIDSNPEVIVSGAKAYFNITANGKHPLTYYALDNAANREAAKSHVVNIDKTLPVTTYSLTGTLGSDDWYTSNVSLSLIANDTISGAAKITYAINNDVPVTVPAAQATINLNTAGTNTIKFYAQDNAGNSEAPVTLTVKIKN